MITIDSSPFYPTYCLFFYLLMMNRWSKSAGPQGDKDVHFAVATMFVKCTNFS